MRKPETTFIASVHAHLPPDLYSLKQHNMYVGGPADMWYSGSADDLWVEYKFIIVPKRSDTIIDVYAEFSPLQQEWLRERHSEGRNVAAIVGCKAGGVLFTNLGWENTFRADYFAAQIKTRKALAEWINSRVSLGAANESKHDASVRQSGRSTRRTK